MPLRSRTYGAIADELNAADFRTRRGNAFTSFAVKDILRCRFYLGLVSYQGDERPGEHEAIVDRDLFEQVQQRRIERRLAKKQPWVTRSLLAGRVSCSRCGHPLWSNRTAGGAPMYREQHGRPCRTLGRSIVAASIDDQVGAVFSALRLDDAILTEALDAIREHQVDGDSVDVIDGQLRRLGRAYADGTIPEAEYRSRLETLRSRRAAMIAAVRRTGIAEAAELVRDLPRLWSAATFEQRRLLVAELMESVEVDLEPRRVESIVAVPAFDALLRDAVTTVEAAHVRLDPLSASGGDGGELNSPSSEPSSKIYYGCSQRLISLDVLH